MKKVSIITFLFVGASLVLACSRGGSSSSPGEVSTPSEPGGRPDPVPQNSRSSIEQYGIRWNFDRAVPAGQFITGDWWVVGPVLVTAVSPAPVGSGTSFRHGSMINPSLGNNGDDTAYDGRNFGFNPSLVVHFPVQLQPGDSLVSTESITSYPLDLDSEPDPYPFAYRSTEHFVVNQNEPALRNAAILTVLAAAPTANCFRPPFIGTAKPLIYEGEVNAEILPSLPRPASAPSRSNLERAFQRPYIDIKREWMRAQIAPINNQVSYGRELSMVVGDAGLFLCLDVSIEEKRKVLYGLIQFGIDHFYASQINSHLWATSGGYSAGREFPIRFAGLMLGRFDMLHVVADFQEDMATYFGSDRSPEQELWTGWQNSGHPHARNVLYQYGPRPDTVGNPIEHENVHPMFWSMPPFPHYPTSPQYPFDKHEGYRRLISWAWIGQAVAARILGMMDAWNHDAYFSYVDRWMNEDDSVNRASIAAAAVVNQWNSLVPGTNWEDPSTYSPLGGICYSNFAREMYFLYR